MSDSESIIGMEKIQELLSLLNPEKIKKESDEKISLTKCNNLIGEQLNTLHKMSSIGSIIEQHRGVKDVKAELFGQAFSEAHKRIISSESAH